MAVAAIMPVVHVMTILALMVTIFVIPKGCLKKTHHKESVKLMTI